MSKKILGYKPYSDEDPMYVASLERKSIPPPGPRRIPTSPRRPGGIALSRDAGFFIDRKPSFRRSRSPNNKRRDRVCSRSPVARSSRKVSRSRSPSRKVSRSRSPSRKVSRSPIRKEETALSYSSSYSSEASPSPSPPRRMGKISIAYYDTRGRKPAVQEGYEPLYISDSSPTQLQEFSPHRLRDPRGASVYHAFEFSKVHEKIYSNTIRDHEGPIWHQDNETHFRDGHTTPEYWRWRERGMQNPRGIYRPHRSDQSDRVLFHYWRNDETGAYERLSAIDARREIFCRQYMEAAKKEPLFRELQDKLRRGVNIEIFDSEGPRASAKRVPFDRLVESAEGLAMTRENVRLLLHNTKIRLCASVPLACALLEHKDWLE